jgi:hypothetical protein
MNRNNEGNRLKDAISYAKKDRRGGKNKNTPPLKFGGIFGGMQEKWKVK